MKDLSQLDWIVEKASEVLMDKVRDAPLSVRDVEIAFDIFASKRLQQIEQASGSNFDEIQAKQYVLMKLQERAKQLNLEKWGKEE